MSNTSTNFNKFELKRLYLIYLKFRNKNKSKFNTYEQILFSLRIVSRQSS